MMSDEEGSDLSRRPVPRFFAGLLVPVLLPCPAATSTRAAPAVARASPLPQRGREELEVMEEDSLERELKLRPFTTGKAPSPSPLPVSLPLSLKLLRSAHAHVVQVM
jgi:hypothetical protein